MSSSVKAYYDFTDAERAATLRQVNDAGPTARMLIRGAAVLPMGGEGDLGVGDVLIENGRVVAVAADLSSAEESSICISARGMIAIPGLVDAHRHCWQGVFRRLIVDADLNEYVATTHGGMALNYTPEDMYLGTLTSCLSALESGITTLLDFSHNSRSAAHSDAVLRAYEDAGIRAVHASAAPNAGAWDHQWPEDLARLTEKAASRGGSLTTVRMGIDMNRVRPAADLLKFARALGLGITFDGVIGRGSNDEMTELAVAELLGPDVTLIHCTDMGPALWERLAENRVGVTLAPTSDAQIGIADGLPPLDQALQVGVEPSLSVDVEISLAGDMFTQMRALLAIQRMRVANRRYHGESSPSMLTNRAALRMATVVGAMHVGLEGVTGALEPGLAADLVLLRAEEIANMPLNNAVGTVVQGVDSASVDTVMVGGAVRKWNGRSLYDNLATLREQVAASRDRLSAASGWTVDPISGAGNTLNRFDHLRDYMGKRDSDR